MKRVHLAHPAWPAGNPRPACLTHGVAALYVLAPDRWQKGGAIDMHAPRCRKCERIDARVNRRTTHIRWTDAEGNPEAMCGNGQCTDFDLIEPHIAIRNVHGGQYCLACIHVLSELLKHPAVIAGRVRHGRPPDRG